MIGVEVVDEELGGYRPWVSPVEGLQKLLCGRDHPFVAKYAESIDVVESVAYAMPCEDLSRW